MPIQLDFMAFTVIVFIGQGLNFENAFSITAPICGIYRFKSRKRYNRCSRKVKAIVKRRIGAHTLRQANKRRGSGNSPQIIKQFAQK